MAVACKEGSSCGGALPHQCSRIRRDKKSDKVLRGHAPLMLKGGKLLS